MGYKIPNVTHPMVPAQRAAGYCCSIKKMCSIKCKECLFDTDDWNEEREKQYIEWEEGHEK